MTAIAPPPGNRKATPAMQSDAGKARLFLAVACIWPLFVLALYASSAPQLKETRAHPRELLDKSNTLNKDIRFQFRKILDRVDVMVSNKIILYGVQKWMMMMMHVYAFVLKIVIWVSAWWGFDFSIQTKKEPKTYLRFTRNQYSYVSNIPSFVFLENHNEWQGYGPTHPRLAVVVVGDDNQKIISSVESLFRYVIKDAVIINFSLQVCERMT